MGAIPVHTTATRNTVFKQDRVQQQVGSLQTPDLEMLLMKV